jgi:hypothetical protein
VWIKALIDFAKLALTYLGEVAGGSKDAESAYRDLVAHGVQIVTESDAAAQRIRDYGGGGGGGTGDG